MRRTFTEDENSTLYVKMFVAFDQGLRDEKKTASKTSYEYIIIK